MRGLFIPFAHCLQPAARLWLTLAATAIIPLTLTPHAGAQTQDTFESSNLASFDGADWNGLTIGRSTTRDIKQQFRTSKGAFRPEALVLPGRDGNSPNVQALTDSRGEDSVLVGFRVAYKGAGPDLVRLRQAYGELARAFYPVKRFSDWHLEAFARHGVVAFVSRTKGQQTIPLLLATTPARAARVLQGFTPRATTISNIKDEYTLERQTARFGQVRVVIRESGLKLADRAGFEGELRRELRSYNGSKRLRYDASSDGVLSGSVALVKPDNKEGTVTTRIAYVGGTALGRLNVERSESRKLDRGAFGVVNVDRRRIHETFDKSLREMRDALEQSIRRQVPSSAQAYQEQTWNGLVSNATQK